MLADAPEQPRQPELPPYLMHWGQIAAHPECVGVDSDDEEALMLGHEALKRYFGVIGRDRRINNILSHDLTHDVHEFMLETGCSGSELLYASVESWYKLLGPTNSMEGAWPLMSRAADALRQEADKVDEPVDRMFTLAGDLYHEAALQCETVDEDLFRGLCRDAQACYEEVVLSGLEQRSRVRQLSEATVAMDPYDVRAIVRATGRYHDLKFLKVRPDMWRVLSGDELDASESNFIVECLRISQHKALSDFSAMLELGKRKGQDGKRLIPLGALQDQFAVLVARNELLTQDPAGWELNRLAATHVRNAFPREAAPREDMPHGLPSFRVNIAAEAYDRTGRRGAALYYRTGVKPNEQLPVGIHMLPVSSSIWQFPAVRLDTATMNTWTNLMMKIADVAPTNKGERDRIREKMAAKVLPFDVRLG